MMTRLKRVWSSLLACQSKCADSNVLIGVVFDLKRTHNSNLARGRNSAVRDRHHLIILTLPTQRTGSMEKPWTQGLSQSLPPTRLVQGSSSPLLATSR